MALPVTMPENALKVVEAMGLAWAASISAGL
jgi:hypothetical protein